MLWYVYKCGYDVLIFSSTYIYAQLGVYWEIARERGRERDRVRERGERERAREIGIKRNRV